MCTRRMLLVLLAACFGFGCARSVDLTVRGLLQYAPYESRADARAGGPLPNAVPVQRADGRTVVISPLADVMIVPRRGPSRLFTHPVAARLEGDVLFVSGANRPEASIASDDVVSVVVYR